MLLRNRCCYLQAEAIPAFLGAFSIFLRPFLLLQSTIKWGFLHLYLGERGHLAVQFQKNHKCQRDFKIDCTIGFTDHDIHASEIFQAVSLKFKVCSFFGTFQPMFSCVELGSSSRPKSGSFATFANLAPLCNFNNATVPADMAPVKVANES